MCFILGGAGNEGLCVAVTVTGSVVAGKPEKVGRDRLQGTTERANLHQPPVPNVPAFSCFGFHQINSK
jgi:hypothetical protein